MTGCMIAIASVWAAVGLIIWASRLKGPSAAYPTIVIGLALCLAGFVGASLWALGAHLF